MTLEDTKGQPHVVIFRSDTELRLVEFDGPNAMEKAHELAEQSARDDYPGCIIVAVRVRQLCSYTNRHLMTNPI